MRNKIIRHAGWIRLILFAVGFVFFNNIVSFLLVPSGNYSRWVQHFAVTPENTYDLIAFGASEALRTWDSQAADEILGTHSYNMGTSATWLDGGIYATFQDTMAHQSPKRVIFFLGRYEMTSFGNESPKSYIAIAPYMSNKKYAAEYYFRTARMGGALKRLFPWTEYHVDSLKNFTEELRRKLSKEYGEYDISLLEGGNLAYRGQGFCPRPYIDENILLYDNMSKKELSTRDGGGFKDKACSFSEQKVEVLKKLISYCKKRNCEVVVVLSPLPITSIFSCPNYNSYSNQLKALSEGEGATYFDLNLAKKEVWNPQLDEFYDESHVNEKGATHATEAICELLQRQERGEDTSKLFYTWEEYLESIDYVVATYMIVKEDEDEIHATAYPVTGVETISEYKFVVYDVANDKELAVLQDFNTANELTVLREGLSEEALALRVYTRVKGGGKEDGVRYYDYKLSGT